MLTLYRPRKSEDSDESDEPHKEKVIPAGTPYLTKINGKLVFAREKKPKTASIAVDLLGEAFGVTTTIVRKRSKSLDRPKAPLLIAGSPCIPQPQLAYTAPIPQQPFPQPGTTLPLLPYQYTPQPPPQYPHPHMYSPNMMQISQFPIPYPPYYPQLDPQRYAIPPSRPTKEDFEQLKDIDAAYKKANTEKKKHQKNRSKSSDTVLDSLVQKEATIKNIITVTKHICGNCGRLRSRKYHHENPIKPGETPTPAFCRKCQKDTTSTSGSGGSKSPKKDKKNRSPGEKEQINLKDVPVVIEVGQPKSKQIPKAAPSEEYVLVEKKNLEDETPRRRIHLLIEGSPAGKHPSRASSNHGVTRNERSQSPVAKREQTKDKKSHSRCPTLDAYEENLYKRNAPSQPSIVRVVEPEQQMGSREDCFDTVSSQRFAESRRRRRVERAYPDTLPTAPWNAPRVLDPQPGDEKMVVTDTFVYRPKKYMEEHRRHQEYADKAYYESQADEASKYYQENWTKDESVHSREDPPRIDLGRARRGRYRRDEIYDPEVVEVADSESSDYNRTYDAVFYDIPRRAPTPAPVSPSTETWPEITPYPISSNEESVQRARPARKGRARHQSPDRSLKPSKRRVRSTSTASSNYCSPLVREALDGGIEKALIPSPLHSPRRVPSYDNNYTYVTLGEQLGARRGPVRPQKRYRQRTTLYDDKGDYDEDEVSDMTERERMAERETKRVTFRSLSPSASPARSGYRSDVTESFLRRKTSWDDSNLAPRPPR